MFSRKIKYTDFDGNEVEEEFWFHISNPEVIDLEVEHPEGLEAWLKAIVAANDNKTLYEMFKKVVLLAYGQRSEDGKRFVKNDQMKVDFSQTAAYEALITDLVTSDTAASEFVKGALPRETARALETETPKPTENHGEVAPNAGPPL